MSAPRRHHFIPVRHLARFSADIGRSPRDRRVAVFDKRRGLRGGLAKAGAIAVETDLYGIRAFDVPDSVETFRQIFDAVFDPAARDPGFEIDEKAQLENDGVDAIQRLLDGRPSGIHILTEDERAPLIAYLGLLLVQHPTLVRERAAAVAAQFRSVLPPRIFEDPHAQRVFDEGARGAAVLATAQDSLATGLELNRLSWRLLRRATPPFFVLGDSAVAGLYPDDPYGARRVDDPTAKFVVPLDPQQVLLLEPGPHGVGLVMDLVGEEGAWIVMGLNRVAWIRAAREVYARERSDLRAVVSALASDDMHDHSRQLPVRDSVLPRLLLEYDGDQPNPQIAFPSQGD